MISIVVPVFNNGDTLEELFERIARTVPASGFEVIFIDDGGTDASLEKLTGLAANNPSVRIVSLSRNFGQHPAICAGLDNCRGDCIVLMDADLQDRPEDIPVLLAEIKAGADIVYTILRHAEETGGPRLTSRLYHSIFSRLARTPVPANIGTFRAFSAKFLAALRTFPEYNILYGPLMFYMGFRTAFVPVEHPAPPRGRGSSYSFLKRLQLATNSLVSYTDIPHKVFLSVGGLVILGTIIYAVAVVLAYVFLGQQMPAGGTLIVMLLLLVAGSTMSGLGILGIYVFRIYQEVLRRPRYIVQRKINLE